MLVIAHRTLPRDAPENSRAGIRRAAELGADGVELDVRRTLDGVPILMHDRTPWRTARLFWPVRLLPSSAVQRRLLRGGTEHVPTLADALAALPSRLFVAIDVKHRSAAKAVLTEVRARRLEARVLVWSEHASVVRFAAHAAVNVEVSLLRDVTSARALRRFLEDAVRLGARGISAHWTVITPTFLDDAHARGLRVYSWCETPDEQADRLHLDLDGVVTEWPAEARATLEAIDRQPNRSGGGAL